MSRQLTKEEMELRLAETCLARHLGVDINTDFHCNAGEETLISCQGQKLVLSNKSCDFVTITATLQLRASDKHPLEIAQLGTMGNSIVTEVEKHPEMTTMISKWTGAFNAARAKLFYEKCRIIRGDDGHRMVSSREHGDIYVVPIELLGGDVPPKGSKTLVLRSVLADIRRSVQKAIPAPTTTPTASSSSASSKVNEKLAISLEAGSPHSRVYFSDPNWVTMEALLSVRKFTDGVSLLHTKVRIGDISWKTNDHPDDDTIHTHKLESSKNTSGYLAIVVWMANKVVERLALMRSKAQSRQYESLVRFLYEVDRAREENLAKMRSKAASSSSSNAKETIRSSVVLILPHSRVYSSDPNWVEMEALFSVYRGVGGLQILNIKVKIGTVSWKTNDHPNDDTIHAHKLESSKDTSGHLAIVVWVANKVVGRLALLRSNTATQDQREYEAIVRFLFEVDRAREENLAKMRSKVASSSSSSKEKDPAPKTITLLEIPGEENKVAVSEEGESTLVPSKSAFQVDYDGPNTVIQVLDKTWKISNSAAEFKYHTLCGYADRHHSSVKFGGEIVNDFVGSDNLIVRQHLLTFLIKVDEERRKRFYRECKIAYLHGGYVGAEVEELDFLVEIHRDWLPNPDKLTAQSTVLVLRSLFDRMGPANVAPRLVTNPCTKAIERVFKRVISQNGTSTEYVFRNLEAPLTPQPSSREQKDASTPIERLTAEASVRESDAAEVATICNSGYGAMGATDLVGNKPEPTTVRCLTCGHVSPTIDETPCRCRASQEDEEPEKLDATTVPSAEPAKEPEERPSLPMAARNCASLFPTFGMSVYHNGPGQVITPTIASTRSKTPASFEPEVAHHSPSTVTANYFSTSQEVPAGRAVVETRCLAFEELQNLLVTTPAPNRYNGVTSTGLRMSYNSETRMLRIIGAECKVPELEKGQTCEPPAVVPHYDVETHKFLRVLLRYRSINYCVFLADDAHTAAVFCQDVGDWLLKLHEDNIF